MQLYFRLLFINNFSMPKLILELPALLQTMVTGLRLLDAVFFWANNDTEKKTKINILPEESHRITFMFYSAQFKTFLSGKITYFFAQKRASFSFFLNQVLDYIMIYKFLKPHNFYKGVLSSYKGTFSEMFVSQNEKEQYCYVKLTEAQMPDFENHFGKDGIILPNNADEYPGSNESMKNNRIENFIRLESPRKF